MLAAPIRSTPGKSSDPPRAIWANAVVSNVKNQVAFSLRRFGSRVVEGKLTIVGAVYDVRDDLGFGAGKLVIVTVNGNSDTERMAAFVAAVNDPQPEPSDGAPDEGQAVRTTVAAAARAVAALTSEHSVSALASSERPALLERKH